MADESSLSEIATLAKMLRQDFRGTLEQLAKDRAALADYERFSEPWRAIQHCVNAGKSQRREYREMLHKLLRLVYRHLPAEGRRLREISREDEPEGWDWKAADVELQGIVVAAGSTSQTATEETGQFDPSAFRPAAELWQSRFKTYKAFRAWLRKTPGVRTRKPSANRLQIHVGDWQRHWTELDAEAFEAVNAKPEVVGSFVAAVRSRQADVKKRKVGGK